METFGGEKNQRRLVLVYKEIAGLLKKMMNMKSRMSGFSRGKLEVDRNELGLCTGRYESKSCC